MRIVYVFGLIFVAAMLSLTGCTEKTSNNETVQRNASINTLNDSNNVTPDDTENDRTNFNNSTSNNSQAHISLCRVDAIAEEIVICNNGTSAVDASGWKISDGEGDYVIPNGRVINGSNSLLISINDYNPEKNTRKLYLNDQHDEVVLYDENGNQIDKKTW